MNDIQNLETHSLREWRSEGVLWETEGYVRGFGLSNFEAKLLVISLPGPSKKAVLELVAESD